MSVPTPQQIDALLNFLEEHSDLARGILRNLEGRVRAQMLWGEITEALNSMGGCIKTTQQWQRVWTDKKYQAKKNLAANKRSANATGGGPSTAPRLSRWDLKVSDIMGDGFGGPQTTARVPAFELPDSPPQVVVLLNQIPPPESGENEEALQAIVNNDPPQPAGSPSEQPLPQRSTNNRRVRRVRQRRVRTEESVRTQFIRIEERRLEQGRALNEEVAGLRQELTNINATLQQLIQVLQQRQ